MLVGGRPSQFFSTEIPMLGLEKTIRDRLRALSAFVGWQVRGATVATDRRGVPAVDVRMGGASVTQVRKPSATLQPEWSITLVVQKSDEAAALLDTALGAVIQALHNWRPADAARSWTELQVARVTEAAFSEAGLVGYEITFTTAAVFDGQP